MLSANFARSAMILLVSALLSVAGSTEREEPVEFVEFVSRYSPDQSQVDLNAVLDAYWDFQGFLKYTPSYGFYRDKTLYGKMTLIQKGAVVNEIVCYTQDWKHERLKRKCAKYAKKCKKSWKKLKVAGSCVNNATTPAEKCYCDPESIPLYCEMLQTQQDLSLTVKGDCTVKDLEDKLSNKTAELVEFLTNFHSVDLREFAKLLENVTHNNLDLNEVIPIAIRQANVFTKMLCEISVETHHTLSRLKKASIHYCLLDDELKRNVLGTQPYAFCEEDTFLGKCMCDPDSFAIFCYMKFTRLLMDTYAGDEKLNCTSACITFFSWTAIISILGLRLLG